jgi:hypothetical protein
MKKRRVGDTINVRIGTDALGRHFWFEEPSGFSGILREQRATAASRNKAGELVIRQRATWDEDRDTFVFISPENEVAFLEGVAKRARE